MGTRVADAEHPPKTEWQPTATSIACRIDKAIRVKVNPDVVAVVLVITLILQVLIALA